MADNPNRQCQTRLWRMTARDRAICIACRALDCHLPL
jgi:hypothetical protein